MRNTNAIVVVLMGVATLACGTSADSPRTLTRDSVGIRLVETELQSEELAQWPITSSPIIQIGVVEGSTAYQFFNIGGVIELSDGRIAVANMGTNELRLYSREGEHLKTLGGEGQGPGEYRGIRYLWRLPGDSILVEDGLNDRMNLYTRDGDLVRTWPARELSPFVTPPPVGRFPDGQWLVLASRTVGEPPDPVEFRGLLVTYASNTPADTIAEIPGGPGYFEQIGPNMVRLHAPFATGSRVAVAGNRILAGNGAQFEIRVLSSRGHLEAIWRVRGLRRAVTPEDIAADKAAILDRARTDNQRRRFEAEYARVPIPESMPAYSRFLTDHNNNLWVEQYHAVQDTTRRFVVLTPDGEPVAEVTVPGDLDVRQVGENDILGIWRDESGVEFVRRYGLDRLKTGEVK